MMSTTPPSNPEAWEKPSIYSVLVIAVVLGLIGYAVHIDKLTLSESLVAAILGVLTWVTKGARPPIADKIGFGGGPPPGAPPPPPAIPLWDMRDPMATPKEPPPSKPRWALGWFALALSCATATPREKSAAADTAYTAEMQACVDDAGSRTESRACRAKVREKWHVDAGVAE